MEQFSRNQVLQILEEFKKEIQSEADFKLCDEYFKIESTPEEMISKFELYIKNNPSAYAS